MPYIFVIRDDIPAGVLQSALDLRPNTSQRSLVYDGPGQTGYRVQPAYGAAAALSSGATAAEASGLGAWLQDNISSSAGTAAVGSITTVAVASLLDGETFTIDDGENSVTFEFVVTAGVAVTAGNVAVDVSGDTTADDVRDTIIPLINASALNVTAASGGAGTVDLTNDNQNQPLADQNNGNNAETVANGTFAITGFASATNSDGLTEAEANTNRDDIETVVKAGTALTHTAINAALTTGNINKEDVSAILDILAGLDYVVPAGTSIEATGAFVGGGGASSGSIRRIYDTGDLKMSFNEGRLSKAVSANFTYGGTAGSAVVVYADDGSVYTV